MKTLRLVRMALFAVLMCANFASCSSDDVAPNEPQNPKEYTVSLGFTGEISVSESPLSRASGNDLYGIQVYSCPTTDETNTYKYYACGLFDDVETIKVKLIEGYKYKFEASMVVDGKNKLNSFDGIIYPTPFEGATLNNSFLYTNVQQESMHSLKSGQAFQKNVGYIRRPSIDRYYGEYADYSPTKNGSIAINMLRTSFGLKVVANNFTEGTLSVELTEAPKMSIVYPDTKKEEIYTFSSVSEAYSTDNYSETISANFTWTKDDGAVIPFGTYNLTFKRNKQTVVTINISDLSLDNNIGITLEDEKMTEGDNITIENGEIIDTNINTGTEG